MPEMCHCKMYIIQVAKVLYYMYGIRGYNTGAWFTKDLAAKITMYFYSDLGGKIFSKRGPVVYCEKNILQTVGDSIFHPLLYVIYIM